MSDFPTAVAARPPAGARALQVRETAADETRAAGRSLRWTRPAISWRPVGSTGRLAPPSHLPAAPPGVPDRSLSLSGALAGRAYGAAGGGGSTGGSTRPTLLIKAIICLAGPENTSARVGECPQKPALAAT